MARRWQYPSWAANDADALTRPEVTTPDKWWQAFSEPARQHAGKLAFAALLASGVAAIDSDALTRPEVTTPDKWWQPLSEPVLAKKPTPVAAYPSTWEDTDALTRPEVTSLDKWFAPLSEPTPPVPGIEQALISSGGIFRIDVGDLDISAEEMSWYKNLELHLNVFTKKYNAAAREPASIIDVDLLTQPEATSLDKWYAPLSEYLHRDKRVDAALYPYSWIDTELLTQPEQTLVSKWVPQTNEPIRTKKTLPTALQKAFFIDAKIDFEEAEDITVDKWYRPLLGIMGKTGLYLSGTVIVPELAEATTLDRWYQQFSQPLLVKEPINVSFGEFSTETDLEEAAPPLDTWYKSLSEPLRIKPRASEFPTHTNDTEGLTQPEVTSLDKWYSTLSEPLRVQKPLGIGAYPSFVYEGEPADVDPTAEFLGWYVPLDEPVLVKSRASDFPSFVTDDKGLGDAENITLDKWYAPLSEYLHDRARSDAALLSGNNYEGEPTDFDPTAEFLGWYRPLEQFLHKDKRVDAALYPYFWMDTDALTRPEVTSLDKWWSPLSEFLYRVKRSAAALEPASIIDSDLLTRPEETLVSKWVPETNEPVRVKARLLTALQQAFFIDADIAEVPPAEEITLDKWYQPHSEPVRVKSRASDFPEYTNDTEGLTQPEVTSLDRWWQPLSEFIHTTKRSAAALEPASTIDTEQLILPEETLVSKWVPQTNEPVRVKKGLLTALQRAFFADEDLADVPPAEEITLDKYWQPLGEPVRVKSRASDFPAHAIDTEGLTLPEVTSLDKWFAPFSEPVRVQPTSLAGLLSGAVYEGNPSDVEPLAETLAWYTPLSEPVLVKARTSEFPASFVDSDALTDAEATTIDRWWRELSEPVRVKARFHEALQRHAILDPFGVEVITLDKWYAPLGEPVLTKAPLPIGAVPHVSFDVGVLAPIFPDWFVPLSTPFFVIDPTTPLKAYLFIDPVALTLAENITIDKWYVPLEEPVRIGDRLVVPFRLPASVGFKLPITAVVPVKTFISKEGDQTHLSLEADMTHISLEDDQTKDSKRC